jgi:hypothetical protein
VLWCREKERKAGVMADTPVEGEQCHFCQQMIELSQLVVIRFSNGDVHVSHRVCVLPHLDPADRQTISTLQAGPVVLRFNAAGGLEILGPDRVH